MTMNTLQQQRLRAGTSNQENRNVVESERDDGMSYYNGNDSGNSGKQSSTYKNSRPSSGVLTNEQNENIKLREKGNSFTNNRGQSIVDVTHIVSPSKVERLTSEIDRLRREMNENESMFEQKSLATERSWQAEIDILRRKLQRKDEELMETKSELSEICRSRESSSGEMQHLKDKLAKMALELEMTQKALEDSKTECNGLRESLGDILEQHEMMKKRSVNMNDRLGSLKVSLNGMLDQQNLLASKVKERSFKVKENLQKRQSKLKELLEMEEIMEQEEDKFEASLQKQSREIEAAAAVVAAAHEEE
jgi:chromosome segregation ATPase